MKITNETHCLTLLFILLLGLANVAWAEPTKEAPEAERKRAVEIMNQAARTQEEFLMRIKTVWDKPEASMVEVAETITGVSEKRLRAYPRMNPEEKYYALNLKYDLHPDAPYYGAFVENVPETAKQNSKGRTYLNLPTGVFIRDDLWLTFYGQTRRNDPQRRLCVTAGKTREILGEPTQMHLKDIDFEYRAFGYEYIDGKRRMTFHYDGVERIPPHRSPLEVVLDRTKDTCLLHFTYEYTY